MLFSMITYPFKLLRNPFPFPHHCRRCNQVSLVILFQFQIFFLEHFCDLQLKRNVFSLILCNRAPHQHHRICTTNAPHPPRLVCAGLLSTAMLFASLHDSFLLFHPLPLALQHFNPPFSPNPSSIHHKFNMKFTLPL